MLILLGVLSLGAFSIADYRNSDPLYHCAEGTHQQQLINLNQAMGLWHVVEVVQHREDLKQQRGSVTVVDTCPMVHLSRDQFDQSNIRLVWKENAGALEYQFMIPSINKPGLWLSSGAQNGQFAGSFLNLAYKQFAGTVEVTKVVNSHMVLTFCSPGTELYSVVMARNRTLSFNDLRGVNRMLEHRGLHRFTVRETCKNSATLYKLSFAILSLLFFISCIMK